MPSQYQAVATYSAKASYQAATGYVTTAEYIGDVTHEGVESVTYVLTYIGTEANHKGRVCRSGRSVFCGSLSLDLRWNRSDLRRCWRHAACMPPKGRSESRM